MNLKTRHIYSILRRDNSITLTEIAKEIGVSSQALGQFERGVINLRPNIFELYKNYIEEKINKKIES